MRRLERVVIPGLPHHVTQRGNRRQQTFFSDDDYTACRELMAEWCSEGGVAVWAYCLMPSHIHLIAAPQSQDALARGIGEAHRRYTRRTNFREHARTGCPLGSAAFLEKLERTVGRRLRPRKPGRPSKLHSRL